MPSDRQTKQLTSFLNYRYAWKGLQHIKEFDLLFQANQLDQVVHNHVLALNVCKNRDTKTSLAELLQSLATLMVEKISDIYLEFPFLS